MKKIIVVIVLIILWLGIHNYLFNNKTVRVNVYKGNINLKNYDFDKNKIVKLEGQLELYNNKLLIPSELKGEKSSRYLTVPSELKDQLKGKVDEYMTLHLMVQAKDDVVYGLKIDELLMDSKVWINGILQDKAGIVNKSYYSERQVYLPGYYYFTAKNGIIDIVIQPSNHINIFHVIKPIYFSTKDKIMNEFIINASIDLIVFGGLIVTELIFLIIAFKLKKSKVLLYLSILGVFVQFKCLFLNEIIIVHLFPYISFEILSKIDVLTNYLWIPVYVLFIKKKFYDLSNKIVYGIFVFYFVYITMCIVTDNILYDKFMFFAQPILYIIIIIILVFLIGKIRNKVVGSGVSIVAFSIVILNCINDSPADGGAVYSRSSFVISMFILILIETCTIVAKYCSEIIQIEKLRHENKLIYEKSIKDNLTGMYNRNHIEEILDKEISDYIRYKKLFTILMMDIDYFKSINDKYGHLVGDNVLSVVSNAIIRNLRKEDFVGRYGGEEFIVVFPNTDKKEAFIIAERIRTDIENLLFENGIRVTISGGIYENSSFSKKVCIHNADRLLYYAKESGRNRIKM
ncbi:diguanylate cyclase (GGDEF)-like protein [Clostridium acetobutylicum]|uniref:Diguanylate cyclase/phosphodiesterase domain (GGDEF) containing protein n=1 Tax=Clostridium acetobutylicum (strain ATCC 824 / DSM 792 / JCM 1419 / IAM 19013 / LMG 5710 / NBRC 13948 / NRRL B-527 / VKM B-1787 / 2291 / W) TaxID=272562 RepID=Q97KU8_CLOAB|nr:MULTISPECIES: diguanylate cyclase [Clostridium]AAK78794.1 Diguanylate cyclase/phosphodiesterase domain (GGDEF) containing protein [Clostridium acetobutylicum ATCC 824]ADZ19868.1 Diguanylate cyclase/phosphodiesterase domain (GGDEF) containing protein [Clostridium acetobutylicum EA 2018]AEI33250.1 diguanylate cyclase/phosphodiesterase [Clostridium acetobutylicum DSM 1731]AWV80512.1 diguanylate cyclase [Clostridium acetobutylicum]MBC2392702.1 diguanylate cyclase [Clostridium acetobutylicum]